MAVSNIKTSNEYTYAEGNNRYDFDFNPVSIHNISVSVTDVEKIKEITLAKEDFEVTLHQGGGKVVLLSGGISKCKNGNIISIQRVPEFKQEINFRNNSEFYMETIEKGFDDRAVADIYLKEKVDRAVLVPKGVDRKIEFADFVQMAEDAAKSVTKAEELKKKLEQKFVEVEEIIKQAEEYAEAAKGFAESVASTVPEASTSFSGKVKLLSADESFDASIADKVITPATQAMQGKLKVIKSGSFLDVYPNVNSSGMYIMGTNVQGMPSKGVWFTHVMHYNGGYREYIAYGYGSAWRFTDEGDDVEPKGNWERVMPYYAKEAELYDKVSTNKVMTTKALSMWTPGYGISKLSPITYSWGVKYIVRNDGIIVAQAKSTGVQNMYITVDDVKMTEYTAPAAGLTGAVYVPISKNTSFICDGTMPDERSLVFYNIRRQ